MIQVLLIILALVSLAATVNIGLSMLINRDEAMDLKGYNRGKKQCESEYLKRDNAALVVYEKEIARLTKLVSSKERAEQRAAAAIEERRLKEMKDAQDQRFRDEAAVASGNFRMWDDGRLGDKAGTCPGLSQQRGGPETVPSAADRNDCARAELSKTVVSRLLVLVNDADDVARQLASAQDVIKQDRVTCGVMP